MTRSKLLEQIKIVSDGTYEDFVTGLAAGTHNIDISGAKKYLKSDATTAVAVLGDFAVDPAK
jgi:hypothetical protein